MSDKTIIVEIQYDTDQAIKNVTKLSDAVEMQKMQQKALKENLDKGLITWDEYNKELAKSQITQKKANEERQTTIKLLGSEAGSINQVKAKIKELEQENGKLNRTTKEGNAQFQANNKQIQSLNETLKAAKKDTGETIGAFGKFKASLTSLPGPIGGVVSGFMAMTKAAMAFIATPLGAIFTAIAAAGALVYNLFKKFDPVIEKLEQGFAAVSAVLSTLDNAFFSFFSGTKSLTESFTGLGASMKDAANRAMELKKAEQDLENQQILIIESNAKAKRQIDELLLQSKDRTKSEKERMALIDQALKIEEDAYNRKKKIADDEYSQFVEKIAIANNLTDIQKKNLEEQGAAYLIQLQQTKVITDDEVKAFAEASAKREEILNESIIIREKAINRQNVLEEKATEEKNKRLEKEKEANEKAAEAAAKIAEQKKADAEKVSAAEAKAAEKAAKIAEQKAVDAEKVAAAEAAAAEKAEQIRQKQKEADAKAEQEKLERRAEAIAQIAEIEYNRVLSEQKTLEDIANVKKEKAAQELAAKLENEKLTFKQLQELKSSLSEEELELELERRGILYEEYLLAESEYKAKLVEIDNEYNAQIEANRQANLQQAYDSMQKIIAATGAMGNKRVTIIADSFSKISTINFKELKSYKDTFVAIAEAASGLTSLITAGHDQELMNLEMQKNYELGLVGDNAEAQDAINRKYANESAKIKKQQAKDDKNAAIIDATIATAIGIVQALANPGGIAGIIIAALVGVLGAVQIASISSQPTPNYQTYAKGGIIGGKSHAQGGTKFYGEDGSMFEAEKGEAMFVMKKDATAEIAALSMINESHGGRSFFGSGGAKLEEGGMPEGQDMQKMVSEEFQRTPIYVKVSDIEMGLTEVSNTKNAGVI